VHSGQEKGQSAATDLLVIYCLSAENEDTLMNAGEER